MKPKDLDNKESAYNSPIDLGKCSYIIRRAPGHRIYVVEGITYDNRKALDILCPQGTPVKAAKSGQVDRVVDGIEKLWDEEEEPPESVLSLKEQDGNYVGIIHPDGEISVYGHLEPGLIGVKEGDYIEANKIFALSGHNGWSIKPHLHFLVGRWDSNKKFTSIDIYWDAQTKKQIKTLLSR